MSKISNQKFPWPYIAILSLVFWPLASFASIVDVQDIVNGTVGLNPNTVSFSSDISTGNFLVMTCGLGAPDVTALMSDSLGNTFNLDGYQVAPDDSDSVLAVFSAQITIGGTDTITCDTTLPSTATTRIHGSEFSGVATSSPLDQETSTGGTSGTVTAGTITPAVSGELFIGAMRNQSSATCFPVSPLSLISSTPPTNSRLCTESYISTTTDSILVGFTQGSQPYAVIGLAYKPLVAGGGGGGTTTIATSSDCIIGQTEEDTFDGFLVFFACMFFIVWSFKRRNS